jgi:hypothetical protein
MSDIPNPPTEPIVQVKLTTGDTLIGILVSEENDTVILKFPLEVKPTMDIDNGSTGWILGKYLIFSGDIMIQLRNDHIISVSAVYEKMKDYYLYSVMYYAKVEEGKFLDDIERALVSIRKKFKKEASPLHLKLIPGDTDISDYDMISDKIH